MSEENKRGLIFIGAMIVIAIIFWALGRQRQAAAVAPAVAPPNFEFYAPYFYPQPGNYPESVPFESTVNINIDNPALAGLANQYIPMFGLVGMTAVRG